MSGLGRGLGEIRSIIFITGDCAYLGFSYVQARLGYQTQFTSRRRLSKGWSYRPRKPFLPHLPFHFEHLAWCRKVPRQKGPFFAVPLEGVCILDSSSHRQQQQQQLKTGQSSWVHLFQPLAKASLDTLVCEQSPFSQLFGRVCTVPVFSDSR